MKTLAILNSSAPFGNINYRESLDILLANASYDRPVALFFFGDGLYQLLANQQAELVGSKDISKTVGLLELYEIEDIYFCQDSLIQRNLTAEDLIIGGTTLDSKSWLAKLNQFDQILSF